MPIKIGEQEFLSQVQRLPSALETKFAKFVTTQKFAICSDEFGKLWHRSNPGNTV